MTDSEWLTQTPRPSIRPADSGGQPGLVNNVEQESLGPQMPGQRFGGENIGVYARLLEVAFGGGCSRALA